MKKIRNSVIFIAIFLILFYYVNKVLSLTPGPIKNFYKEPKNSIDVVYVGSSNAFAHFNTVLAYEEFGFTTGMIASNGQPFQALKHLVEESRKTQKPKVFVIDMANLYYTKEFHEGAIREVNDSLRFSKNKLSLTKELLKQSDIKEKEYVDYYFNFFKYHSSWKYVNYNNFNQTYLYKGYLFQDSTTKILPQENYSWNYDIIPMNKTQKRIVNDLIKYVKKNNLEVIFTIPIRNYTPELMGNLNDLTKVLEEKQLKIINFNTINEIGIDYSHDLYNTSHINVWGATKYTRYFANYLKQNYDLPDHRNDKNYETWHKEYERFTGDYKKIINEEFK